MRTALAAAGLLTLVALAGGQPAQARTVAFTLGGSISISEPGTANLTAGSLTGLAGSSFTGSLGNTTVTDTRNGVVGWTTTIAQSTTFSNGTTTIPAGNTKAWVSGAILPSSGVATVTAGTHITQATGLTLSGSGQAFVSASAVVGNNTTTFNPSIAVSIPSNATAGSYSGVITQTVS